MSTDFFTSLKADLDDLKQRTDWTGNKLMEAIGHIQALTSALDNAFISSWQSTAAWQKELDAAKRFLNNE